MRTWWNLENSSEFFTDTGRSIMFSGQKLIFLSFSISKEFRKPHLSCRPFLRYNNISNIPDTRLGFWLVYYNLFVLNVIIPVPESSAFAKRILFFIMRRAESVRSLEYDYTSYAAKFGFQCQFFRFLFCVLTSYFLKRRRRSRNERQITFCLMRKTHRTAFCFLRTAVIAGRLTRWNFLFNQTSFREQETKVITHGFL